MKVLVDRNLGDVRAELGAATFDAVWSEGREMSWSQAVEAAIARARS
jgi:hypothetical protein